jgi:hypothetical protein
MSSNHGTGEFRSEPEATVRRSAERTKKGVVPKFIGSPGELSDEHTAPRRRSP